MSRLRSSACTFGRHWFTGALLLLAGAGYVFYTLLWGVRWMQTHVKIAVVMIAVMMAVAGVAGWRCVNGKEGGERVELIVERGQSLWAVARQLRARGVVCSARLLVVYMKATGLDRSVQAGLHQFNTHDGLRAASVKLQKAIVIETPITITEGLTIEQTASAICAVFRIDSARIVQLCGDPGFIGMTGIEAASLEGYLFPDTYRFPPDIDEETVLKKMIARFEEQYARVQLDFAQVGHLSRHEIITMASIVEKEATIAEERGRISGVFHNRLRQRIPLGADPTVRYLFRKFSGPLRVSELQTRNPYNTRVMAGLPPGPICSPGLAAIQAAAAPMETKDLYFVARWDGSGAHDFSRTLAEHERKKHEFRRLNEERLRQLKRGGS